MSVHVIALSFIVANYNTRSDAYSFGIAQHRVHYGDKVLG